MTPRAASRGNGVAFYLLGTGFVLAWGACALATRVVRGPDSAASSLPPTRTQIAGFFTTVILLMGVFVWQWAELSNKSDRDIVLGFLFDYGAIILELGDPNIEVVFNGQPVDVSTDGRAVVRLDKPGGFLIEVYRGDELINNSEMPVYSGMTPILTSGLFVDATQVVVTGPIRASITQE